MALIGRSRASYSATNPFLTPCEYPKEKMVTGNMSEDSSISNNLFEMTAENEVGIYAGQMISHIHTEYIFF